jgi:hypothetical protein
MGFECSILNRRRAFLFSKDPYNVDLLHKAQSPKYVYSNTYEYMTSMAYRGCVNLNMKQATMAQSALAQAQTVLFKGQKKNSEDLVRQRTIPTERPPLVGEVSASVV